MNNIISHLNAFEVFNSRGNPTIEVHVILKSGHIGIAQVPEGASIGSMEAKDLIDSDKSRLNGNGKLNAIHNILHKIAPAVIGLNPYNIEEIDNCLIALDGTENKEKLGANAILGVSMATLFASSKAHNVPLHQYIGGIKANTLPVPMMNMINGGMHADNKLDIQEFMIMPISGDTFFEAMVIASEIFASLRNTLKKYNQVTNVGDEGGFAPQLKSTREALDMIMLAIDDAGYIAGKDVLLAIDVAASELYQKGMYNIEQSILNTEQMIDYYTSLIKEYPIFSIEDPMSEFDQDGFIKITQKLSQNVQLVADDIFVTNPRLIKDGINKGIANAVLIKPNQIGTISETFKAIQTAKTSGYRAIISHRSGETEDTSISHIAVGMSLEQIKAGSMSRMERVAKYNEIIRMESVDYSRYKYAGNIIIEQFTKQLHNNHTTLK